MYFWAGSMYIRVLVLLLYLIEPFAVFGEGGNGWIERGGFG
jgi:hypothetical protein